MRNESRSELQSFEARLVNMGANAYLGVVGNAYAMAIRLAIPVILGISQTVTNSDGLVAKLGERGQHVFRQVVRGLVEDIVADCQPFVTLVGT